MQQGQALFRQQVRAILVGQCLDCHGGKSVKADFDLSTREALVESGLIGADAKSSYLYSLITHAEEPHMPHGKDKLPAEMIAAIGKWLDLGAPYDKPLVAGTQTEPASAQVTEDDRQFWSFQPLQSGAPPAARDEEWVKTPVDRFILAKQEELGLSPRPEADRRTLIRRAYFDLLGLPPTPEEVEAFVNDPDPQAYARLIDRLLESPHYGERWARHWMDVARFAESHGYEQDYDRPTAYPYRDFLIQAFNADLPYDKFVRWQLAGDELRPDEPLAWMATGFLGAGAFPTQLTETEFESARYDELDDMTATTGVAFLGLSVGCARCHDHKFDPIPTADYYRLASSFTTAIRSERELELDAEKTRARLAVWQVEHTPLVAELQRYEREELRRRFDDSSGTGVPPVDLVKTPTNHRRDACATAFPP
jgi:cytochrome c553